MAPTESALNTIFVYGALMNGCELHQHMRGAEFLGRASVSGLLYSTGRYPGLKDGSGVVRGELFRFSDIAVALEVLDEVEGYDPLDPAASEYVRDIRSVRLEEGPTQPAWVYLYNREVEDGQRIASGMWVSRS